VSVIKLLIYFISSMFIVGGAACLSICFLSGSIQALGRAVMFLCFGVAGILLGIYLETILNAFKQDRYAA
jgi:hypothetical protein